MLVIASSEVLSWELRFFSSESRHSFLLRDCRMATFGFSSFTMISAVDFQNTFLILRMFPYVTSLLSGFLITEVWWIFSNFYLCWLRYSCDTLHSSFWCGMLHWLIFLYWSIYLSFKKYFNLFIWLLWVFVVACKIFSLWHVNLVMACKI